MFVRSKGVQLEPAGTKQVHFALRPLRLILDCLYLMKACVIVSERVFEFMLECECISVCERELEMSFDIFVKPERSSVVTRENVVDIKYRASKSNLMKSRQKLGPSSENRTRHAGCYDKTAHSFLQK